MLNKLKDSKGFGLIEISVVVIIVAIVAGLTFIVLNSQSDNAQKSADLSTLNSAAKQVAVGIADKTVNNLNQARQQIDNFPDVAVAYAASPGPTTGYDVIKNGYEINISPEGTMSLNPAKALYPQIAASYGDLQMLLPLGRENGLQDPTGGGYSGTAQGGLAIGTVQAGPLKNDDQGATNFDGSNDAIFTNFPTRRNYILNPDMVAPLNLSGKWNVSASAWGSGTYSATSINDPEGGPNMAQLDMVHDSSSGDHQTQFDSYPYTGAEAMQVTPGESISSKVDIKHVSGPAYSGGVNNVYHLYIMFFNSSGAYLSALSPGPITNYQTGQWRTVQVSGSVPANAATAKISIRFRSSTPNSVTRTYVRRPLLEKTANSSASYFSGNGYIENVNSNWVTDNGLTGWLSGQNSSASDFGVFANGTSRTFMGWGLRDTTSGEDALMGALSGVSTPSPLIQIASSNYNNLLFFSVDGVGSYSSNDPVPLGEWFHWAVTFDEINDQARFYLNGQLVATRAPNTAYVAAVGDLIIGARRSASFAPFDGQMAWVSVHSKSLTAAEIERLYLAGQY
jgi:prepilin-type N-terminal cleavage/methylation domain-containing protein